MTYAISCTPEDAPKLREWLANRGGIAVWKSINLSNPGGEWLTPSLDEHGKRTPKPTWQAGNEPSQIVVMADRVGVYTEALFKAFTVSVRMSGNGLSLKLTDASQRRLDRAMEACNAKHGSAHFRRGVLDSDRPSMGVYYVTGEVPLSEWRSA